MLKILGRAKYFLKREDFAKPPGISSSIKPCGVVFIRFNVESSNLNNDGPLLLKVGRKYGARLVTMMGGIFQFIVEDNKAARTQHHSYCGWRVETADAITRNRRSRRRNLGHRHNEFSRTIANRRQPITAFRPAFLIFTL